MPDSKPAKFVADGANRLAESIRAKVLPSIQLDVESEDASRLAAAGFFGRFWLNHRIDAEVERRVSLEIAKHDPRDLSRLY